MSPLQMQLFKWKLNLWNDFAGEITIVTLGPLTNIALAATLDKNFKNNTKAFYHMGSRIYDYTQLQGADFNFGLDPESNEIFFNTLTKTMSIITSGDVVRKYNITSVISPWNL